MVLPASHKVSRVSWYSGSELGRLHLSPTGLLPPLVQLSSYALLRHFSLLDAVRNPRSKLSGLGSFPFARRYSGNRCFFLFLRVLRCFSSLGFPPIDYVFIYRILGFAQVGFPIRISPVHRLCAPTPSLSQLITSFIGSWCQGIHHALFVA